MRTENVATITAIALALALAASGFATVAIHRLSLVEVTELAGVRRQPLQQHCLNIRQALLVNQGLDLGT